MAILQASKSLAIFTKEQHVQSNENNEIASCTPYHVFVHSYMFLSS